MARQPLLLQVLLATAAAFSPNGSKRWGSGGFRLSWDSLCEESRGLALREGLRTHLMPLVCARTCGLSPLYYRNHLVKCPAIAVQASKVALKSLGV